MSVNEGGAPPAGCGQAGSADGVGVVRAWGQCVLGHHNPGQEWVGCAPQCMVFTPSACLTAAHSPALCGVYSACRLILETDPQTVAARVTMRGADSEVPIAEQVRFRPAGQQQQPNAGVPCCRSHNRGTPADSWLAASLCGVRAPPPAASCRPSRRPLRPQRSTWRAPCSSEDGLCWLPACKQMS